MHPVATFSLIALASITGCGAEFAPPTDGSAPAEDTASTSSAIRDGYTDDGDAHVVGIARLEGNQLRACTGTLIAPNVVLTAQHCIASPSEERVDCATTVFGPPHAPSNIFVTTNQRLSTDPNEYVLGNNYFAAREIMVPPGQGLCGFDLALIVLDTPVPTAAAIPAVPRVDATVVSPEPYYIVGYGSTNEGARDSGLRRRRDDLSVTCVGDGCFTENQDIKEWVGDTGICSGDSGGPAFDLNNRVIGVASRGTYGCNGPVYGHIFSWADWLKESTAYASELAGLETPSWTKGGTTEPQYHAPVGGVCKSGDECAGGGCLNNYCTRPCDEAATCPGGYACNSEGWCAEDNGAGAGGGSSNDADEGERRTVSSCSVSTPGHLSSKGASKNTSNSKDPTKPIPWKTAPLALAAVAMLRRRRRAS